MRYLSVITLLLISNFAIAQKSDDALSKAVKQLDEALISKDTMTLKTLLSDQLTYGHSNGWIEVKQDVISDLYNGKLTYKQIKQASQTREINGKVASVRIVADLDIIFNDKPLQIKLSILQVWKKEHRNWKLFARQSVKI